MGDEPNASGLQTEIDRISWYHDFDFPGGLKARATTPDADFHRRLWRFIEHHLDTIDFHGKSVLDIGCWDGYWSFFAERKGARRVLATDDVSQNWTAGEGLRLARRLLGSQIAVDQSRSVYQLRTLNETFDVILFLGVYYHLYDPLYAFAQIRHCAHQDTIVVFEGDVGRNLVAGEVRYCFQDAAQAAFLPSIDALDMMIEASYFRIDRRAYFTEFYAQTTGFKRWWKQSSVRRLWKQLPLPHTRRRDHRSPVFDRSLLVCRPFAGVNKLHYYRPPFDLSVFDSRFG
jgi:tRNA (mo5U34)-methyltransferase